MLFGCPICKVEFDVFGDLESHVKDKHPDASAGGTPEATAKATGTATTVVTAPPTAVPTRAPARAASPAPSPEPSQAPSQSPSTEPSQSSSPAASKPLYACPHCEDYVGESRNGVNMHMVRVHGVNPADSKESKAPADTPPQSVPPPDRVFEPAPASGHREPIEIQRAPAVQRFFSIPEVVSLGQKLKDAIKTTYDLAYPGYYTDSRNLFQMLVGLGVEAYKAQWIVDQTVLPNASPWTPQGHRSRRGGNDGRLTVQAKSPGRHGRHAGSTAIGQTPAGAGKTEGACPERRA